VCIPRSWCTLEYFNDKLLVRTKNTTTGVVRDYKMKLTHKNFSLQSLANEIEIVLAETIRQIHWGVLADPERGTISISVENPGHEFWILSVKDISKLGMAYVSTLDVDPSNPQTCNNVPGNVGHHKFTTYWTSGFVDVVGIHNVYITCSQFGNNSIGPQGERNILNKIVTDAAFGGLIVYNWEPYYDSVDCSNILIKTLDFRITDAYGNVIPLHGSHVSFTRLFCPKH
jgi:hypothetical protein